jgi:hypothetical protein
MKAVLVEADYGRSRIETATDGDGIVRLTIERNGERLTAPLAPICAQKVADHLRHAADVARLEDYRPGEVAQLRAEVRRLEGEPTDAQAAEIERLKAMLGRLQWSDHVSEHPGGNYDRCPVCRAALTPGRGHDDSCELAALIEDT